MSASTFLSKAGRRAVATVGGAALLAALSACDLPFGLGTPTERALESGAEASLSGSSFEIKGSYTGVGVGVPAQASGARAIPAPSSTTWSIDLQISRLIPAEHMVVTGTNLNVEAIILGGVAYFTGHQFLSDHMGSDPISRALVSVAGNAWWKGSAGLVPQLPDFTSGSTFRSTFLGPAVTQRSDHVSVDGIDAVDLSGPRADVYIASAPPNQLLLVQMKRGAVIDGLGDGDLRYGSFGTDFGIKPPTDVIDFSNLSTLPPIYTVVSVDTTNCVSPCVVSAVIKNLGGITGARSPSTITFNMTSSATGAGLGNCQAQVVPDVGYNATTTVGCTINLSGAAPDAAIVTATADNPGRA